MTNESCPATLSITEDKPITNGGPKTRGYVDGCFDLMHSGHFNAIRQASKICDRLVVGIHTDEVITANKSMPVIRQEERYAILKHLKWVDEVFYDTPYTPTLDTLEAAKADFCVHGDDMPTDSNGDSAYGQMIKANRMQIIRRTEGISTTDLVSRILHFDDTATPSTNSSATPTLLKDSGIQTLGTVRRISEFAGMPRPPTKDDIIVYVDGSFDYFNVAHASLLEKAKSLGTYLIVGVYDDPIYRQLPDGHKQLHGVYERVLAVLACKHVDDVIIGCPYTVSEDLLVTLKVSYVVSNRMDHYLPDIDPYAIPREKGMYTEVEHEFSYLTKDCIINRVLDNKDLYIARNKKRVSTEEAYYAKKQQYQEGIQER